MSYGNQLSYWNFAGASNTTSNPQPANKWQVVISPAVSLKGRWKAFLNAGTFFNTIPNISAALNNNKVNYTIGGVGTFTCTFPDGSYSTAGLNAVLNTSIVANGGTTGAITIGIYSNEANSLVTIAANSTAANVLDLTSGNFYQVLGFTATTLTGSTSVSTQFVSTYPASLQSQVSQVNILVSPVVSSSSFYINGGPTNCIYSTSIQAGNNQQYDIQPPTATYVEVDTTQPISLIVISFVDQNLNLINFNQQGNYFNNYTTISLTFRRYDAVVTTIEKPVDSYEKDILVILKQLLTKLIPSTKNILEK